MLSDDRSINMVDEMLGIIPGQTRSYVSSATGSISLGGTPLSPQQLPIHTANCMTGYTYGTPSAAAKSLMTAVLQTLVVTNPSNGLSSKTVTFGATISLAAGTAIYDSAYTYIGTVATNTTTSTTAVLVNLPTQETSTASYYTLTNPTPSTAAFDYNFDLPVDTITSNNVSYTFQAGDDFEQETMTYGKNQGFSVSGGSGGAIDMNASYMAQAVRLAVQPFPTTTSLLTVTSGAVDTIVAFTGYNSNFVSGDVGRKLYTKGGGTGDAANSIRLIGTIKTVTNATDGTVQLASAWTSPGQFEYTIGGFSGTLIPAPIEDLIFARCRLFIDDVAAFPLANPTPVIYQFLAFSYGLQCSWTPKFTGEGQQGIDPTWSFALFTNYSVNGDFTVEHDTVASGKYPSSSVESLKYAWRNRIPKIIQIDCPGSTTLNWFTPAAGNLVVIGSGTETLTATKNSTTITASTYTWVTADIGKDVFIDDGGTFIWVGRIASLGATVNANLAKPFRGDTITSAAGKGYYQTITQPVFPVDGYGPTKTYTGVSFRMPVQIMQVSPISDNDGNDVVTVSWQMRYDSTAGKAGDVRIINQLATLPVAG
jgi:hypothetical protein